MPVRKVKLKDGSVGYQWGTTGKIYKKREDAEKQGLAILLSQRKKRKMKITKELYNELKAKVESLEKQINGGKGSGNFGHSGRPGEVGGSAPSSDGRKTSPYDYKAGSHEGRPVYMVTVPEDTGFSFSTDNKDGKLNVISSMEPQDVKDSIKALFEVGLADSDAIRYKADGYDLERANDPDYYDSFDAAGSTDVAIHHLALTVTKAIKDLQYASSNGQYGIDRFHLPDEDYRKNLSLAQQFVSNLKADKNTPAKVIKKLEDRIDVIDRAYKTISDINERTIVNPSYPHKPVDATDMFDNPKTKKQTLEEMTDMKPRNSAFTATPEQLVKTLNGGKGSGNFGHAGRPGERGGSAPAQTGVPVTAGKTGVDLYRAIGESNQRLEEAKRHIDKIEHILGKKPQVDPELVGETSYIYFDQDGKHYSYEKRSETLREQSGDPMSRGKEVLSPEEKKAEADEDWGASWNVKGSDIKKKLKSYGLATDGLSVRRESGGYSDAWYISGSGSKLDLPMIEKIVKRKLEHYDVDERSGEILAGGNTFVFVRDTDKNMLYQKLSNKLDELALALNGGKGSGNFGHAGRPGEVGGSVPEGPAPKSDADKSGKKPKTEKQLTKEITSLREQASKLFAEKRDLMLETDPEKYSSVPQDIKKEIDALDKKLDETYSKITKLMEERDKLGEKKTTARK